MQFQTFSLPENSSSGGVLLSSCMFYFNTGQGENASGESAYYPFSSLLGIDPYNNTNLILYFKSLKWGPNATDQVRLQITANKHKLVTERLI